MDAIEKLSALFRRFPGIGPRQAERFVQFLLHAPPTMRRELVELIHGLSTSVHQCPECCRFSSGARLPASETRQAGGLCSICNDSNRDKRLLMAVASDADVLALERSGTYRGNYFVLGGTISLASEKIGSLRIKQLKDSVTARLKSGLQEIILAFPANPEGDATAIRLKEELSAFAQKNVLSVTSLGRGLSTGSELEYADPETLKNALDARK